MSQLTDERLKSWLNTNQAARERMCLALLALDERFQNPRPRRPEGGPDGARDIEVEFNGVATWGAVGFRNNANDSPDDKKWVKNKFKGDLAASIKANPNLKSFVFFTNVDITPGEATTLMDHAAEQGMHPTLHVAGRDAYGTRQGTSQKAFGTKALVWSHNPDEQIQSTAVSSGLPAQNSFDVGGHMHKRGPYPNIAAMDKKTVFVYVTRPLFDQMASIWLGAGGYVLTGSNAENLEWEKSEPLSPWPEPLTESEASTPWVLLRAKREPGSHPRSWPKSWSLDFSKFTPEKY